MTTTVQVATEAELSVLAQLRGAWTAEIDPGAGDKAFAGRFSSGTAGRQRRVPVEVGFEAGADTRRASLMVSFARSGNASSDAKADASVDLPLPGGPDTTMESGSATAAEESRQGVLVRLDDEHGAVGPMGHRVRHAAEIPAAGSGMPLLPTTIRSAPTSTAAARITSSALPGDRMRLDLEAARRAS